MLSIKVVTPVKTGVQRFYNCQKQLDSGLRRNDRELLPETFVDCTILISLPKQTPTIPLLTKIRLT